MARKKPEQQLFMGGVIMDKKDAERKRIIREVCASFSIKTIPQQREQREAEVIQAITKEIRIRLGHPEPLGLIVTIPKSDRTVRQFRIRNDSFAYKTKDGHEVKIVLTTVSGQKIYF